MDILSRDITKLTVINVRTGEEIAVVTNDEITTAGTEIVVKLTSNYDQCSLSTGG